jgi:protein-tyrosine phosphatase
MNTRVTRDRAVSGGRRAFTDFHSHLMPGVDDGAQRAADSAFGLAQFRAEGVATIITTPHFRGSLTADAAQCEARLAELDRGWEALRQIAADESVAHGTALRVERGVELMLDVPEPDLQDPRLRLAGGPFTLVEYPGMRLPPINAEYPIASIRRRGWIPVLAHPERYRNLDDGLMAMQRIRAAGACFQLNAGSLFGDYGTVAATHARNILSAGFADYVSSDYHARGAPGVRRFFDALVEGGFAVQAELLAVTNPARLLAGEMPLPVPPLASADDAAQTQQARPWWVRLLGTD